MRTTSQQFDYWRCSHCGLVFTPAEAVDLTNAYPPGYYAVPEDEVRLRVLAAKERPKLELLATYRSHGGDLLEIGPAWGSFAYAAKLVGYNVTAVEIDERCCEFLERVAGVAVLRPDASGALPSGLSSYDVIVLWQTLEHMTGFEQVVAQLARSLRPAGIMAISTPNPDAWQFAVMGASWPHIDAPRHLQLIPPRVLTGVLERHGLAILGVTSDSPDDRGWNRFGWQRVVINRLPRWRGLWRVGLGVGAGLSVLAAPFDRRPLKGATYTVVAQRSSQAVG